MLAVQGELDEAEAGSSRPVQMGPPCTQWWCPVAFYVDRTSDQTRDRLPTGPPLPVHSAVKRIRMAQVQDVTTGSCPATKPS